MTAVVAQLSRKSWTEVRWSFGSVFLIELTSQQNIKASDLCLSTLISVLRADLTGEPSLEIVRLLNRMIKERRFNVHPNALSALLHLRLKTELGGIRASH